MKTNKFKTSNVLEYYPTKKKDILSPPLKRKYNKLKQKVHSAFVHKNFIASKNRLIDAQQCAEEAIALLNWFKAIESKENFEKENNQ